jgi:hypothetical protein
MNWLFASTMGCGLPWINAILALSSFMPIILLLTGSGEFNDGRYGWHGWFDDVTKHDEHAHGHDWYTSWYAYDAHGHVREGQHVHDGHRHARLVPFFLPEVQRASRCSTLELSLTYACMRGLESLVELYRLQEGGLSDHC